MKFLGYDPGGKGTHGVAAIEVAPSGEIVSSPVCDVVENSAVAWEWLTGQNDVSAFGIDTLMAWSPSGGRACDNALRRRYREFAASVIPQNALYSSMTINGAMIARRAATLGWPLYESHPKLVIRILAPRDPASRSILECYASIKAQGDGSTREAKRADDMADAVVAAWCAAQGFLRNWKENLFEIPEDQLERVVPRVSYPWPESIT